MANGLNTLGPRKGATSARKRVGRGPGSGLGKTSGRGHKGENSRSGHKSLRGHEGGQMPLHRRVPKRGFTNIFKKQWATVSVADLDRIFDAGAAVDLTALRAAGAVQGKAERELKILGTGEITKALSVTAHRFTEGAKKKIEAAGGRCAVTEVTPA